MSAKFEREHTKVDDFSKHGAATRVPIVLCVDASYSMLGQKINAVNTGIINFLQEASNDPYGHDAIEICIISFGGEKAQVLQPFAPISSASFQLIRPSGGTPLGEAVDLAIGELYDRMDTYRSMGIQTHRAHLIIMSDGAADGDTRAALHRLRTAEQSIRMDTMCIRLGDDESGDKALRDFSTTGELMTCDELNILDFFSWVSQSVLEVSKEIAGEDSSQFGSTGGGRF